MDSYQLNLSDSSCQEKSHYKTCFKCNKVKPLSEFYKHPQMADGHVNKCKDCNKNDVAQNYENNRAHYIEYERKRWLNPERRAKALQYQRNGRKNNPERTSTYNRVSKAFLSGNLCKKPCEICNNPETEAHHNDYSKPFDINWLCREHHLEIHGKKSA